MVIAEHLGVAATAIINSLSPAVIAPAGATISIVGGNIPRSQATTDLTTPLSTGVMRVTPVYLQAGQVVTNISFCSAAQAATATIANWWFALYSPALALLRQTADQTTGAWAANTIKTLALSSPYTIATAGNYLAAIMFKTSGTCPTLWGVNAGNAAIMANSQNGTSSGSLTTTAPDPAGALTEDIKVPWVELT